jgi:2-phospho-L-lactate guanylyltransferase
VSARLVAIVPVGALDAAKSRLGAVLDAEERRDLAVRMLVRTLAASLATPGIYESLVISPDHDALTMAAAAGARTLRQRTQGLNAGLAEARDDAVAGGATGVLVLPIDLPLVTVAALQAVIDAGPAPIVALVPDRHGRGSNALLLRPPDAIPFAFGGDSRDAHAAAARAAGVPFVEIESPLSVDLDTADDLLMLESLAPEVLGAA